MQVFELRKLRGTVEIELSVCKTQGVSSQLCISIKQVQSMTVLLKM